MAQNDSSIQLDGKRPTQILWFQPQLELAGATTQRAAKGGCLHQTLKASHAPAAAQVRDGTKERTNGRSANSQRDEAQKRHRPPRPRAVDTAIRGAGTSTL